MVISASLSAAIITKTFSLTADAGPFAGTTGSGTFTYDDVNIFADGFSNGGYSITRAEGLTIEFTVFGQTYTENDERGVGVQDTAVPAIYFNSNYDILGIDYAVSEIAVEENGLTSTVVDIDQAGVSGFSFTTDLTLQQDGSYSGGMVVELNADTEPFPWEIFMPAILGSAKQPPPEPPPPPPEGVTILPTDTFYVDSIDYLHIIGEIFNNTSDYIEFVKVYVNIFNGEQLADTDFTYTTLSTVSPYEKVCFHILLPNPLNWTKYTFEAPQFSTTDVAPPELTPYSLSGSYDGTFGWYEIIGLVRNDSDRLVEFVQPVATLYDASGMARDCEFTYVNSTDLDPGQSSSFDMLSTDRDFNDITSYRIQVDGN